MPHSRPPRRIPQPTNDRRTALVAYWRFYEPQSAAISQQVRDAALEHPEWRSALGAIAAPEMRERELRARSLQRAAVLDDEWRPYVDALHAQGEEFSKLGVSYSAWFDILSLHRRVVRGRIVALAREDLDASILVSDGMNHLVDITIQAIGEAYLDEGARDLARSEERYRMMFEKSPTPMWTYDRESLRFVAVNEAATHHYGYTPEEFLAMTLADIRPADDLAALHDDVKEGVSLTRRVWRHRKKDGSLISVEVQANDFTSERRELRLVLAEDVTERERAREQLRKTEELLRQAQKLEAIGRLAGGVAHDFNNLLTVIQSYAELLEEQLDTSDPRRADATEILRASHRAHGITRQLLAVSRQSAVSPVAVNLSALVDGFLPTIRRLTGEQISLTVHVGQVSDVVADPGQLEQVLMNLAVNARDAMPDGGRLVIETSEVALDADAGAARGVTAGRYVALSVTDTGRGMDAQTSSRIFEPFFTTKEVGKGTGLGLAIVHGIISQAGGSISVYSEPGNGTAFWVHLPVRQHDVVAPAPVQVAPTRALPPVTVLVVDDQPEIRALASRVLREAGCTVIEAATSEDARNVCASYEHKIDVALLDLILADGRGDALLETLRELRPELELVLMSGYPAGALSRLDVPAADLLVKPFSPAQLRAAIALKATR